jgi:hypothetical protein
VAKLAIRFTSKLQPGILDSNDWKPHRRRRRLWAARFPSSAIH